MPILHVPAYSRGKTKLDWLASFHSFSFGEFYDPEKMGFGKLRVLNDDLIGPSAGFPMHFHDNMEIVTLVLEGNLEHRDSMGNHGIIKAGQMQRMTAGSGIRHSEFNPSKTEPVHLLQIWILPSEKDLVPSYEQKEFSPLLKSGGWQLVVSPKRQETALFIHQDVRFLMGEIEAGDSLVHALSSKNKGAYCFLIKGELQLGGQIYKAGDAAVVTEEKQVALVATQPSLCLLIETSC